MIYIERTINIEDNSAYIEEPVILYKGDRNIEVQFIINNNPFKYKAGIDLTYGQLVIKRPTTDPIFSDVAKLSSGKVLFVITGEMIDELVELGNYDFQVRLLNADKTSRATLPPVTAGILIKEPVCEEEGVNYSLTGYSRAATGEVLDVFDENGDYIKTTWVHGDLITDSKLNKIENALYEINEKEIDVDLSGYLTEVPAEYITESELNAKGYLTEHQSLSGYATKEDLETKANAADVYTKDETATKTQINAALAKKSDASHNHDDKYSKIDHRHDVTTLTGMYTNFYTKTQVENRLAEKADKTHKHKIEEVTDLQKTLNAKANAADVYTKTEVDSAIANAQLGGGDGTVDLSGYATKDHTHDEYALKTDIPSTEGLATKDYVDDMLGDIESLLGGI